MTAVGSQGVDAPATLRALKLLVYLGRQWNPLRDTVDAFLQDIRELSMLPDAPAERQRIEQFLGKFFGRVAESVPARLRTLYAASLIPCLVSINSVIDMRAVFKEPFGSTPKLSASGYTSQCVDVVPVAIVNIRRSGTTEPTGCLFQCEEHEIEFLIEHLTATLKDCRAAKDCIRF